MSNFSNFTEPNQKTQIHNYLSELQTALPKLKISRAKNSKQRIAVGSVIYKITGGSFDGLQLWKKWVADNDVTINLDADWDEIGFAIGTTTIDAAIRTLRKWVGEDYKEPKIKQASDGAKPKEYLDACHRLGYTFKVNDMDDRLYVNGEPVTDGITALIMTKLGDLGFKSNNVFLRAIRAEGEENKFHPVRDYLEGLEWDGEDHLGRLASYFIDKDNIFPLYIRKWMIGAVSKVLVPRATEQNPMLVLAGGQGLGKSVFVSWLGSPLSNLYVSSPIRPDDKDYKIMAFSTFIWEVQELGGTIRKSDVESLKGFINASQFTVRPPYCRFEITKPVTASYIGTVNLDGNGILNDSTGSRRFRISELERVNWAYGSEINVNQLWGQAVALLRQGETYHMSLEEEMKTFEINERHTMPEPYEEHILEYFEIDRNHAEWILTMGEITNVLRTFDVIKDVADPKVHKRIAPIIKKLGAEDGRFYTNEKRVRAWKGIRAKENYARYTKTIHQLDIPGKL